MDKIRELIKKIGGSDELANQIMEALAQHKTVIEKGVAAEFKKRLDNAKKVCVEEVESNKADLRRKVEIFLESRINTIDREAQRQVAIGEAEATRKLKGVKSLVEGIQIDGKTDIDQTTLVAESKKLRLQVSQLSEELGRANAKATRANEIAMKVLKRNQVLESKTVKPVSEGKEPETLEGLRKPGASPVSTRPVLTEAQKSKTQGTQSGDPEILALASQLDGTPAFVNMEN